jgi:hypothetical protein
LVEADRVQVQFATVIVRQRKTRRAIIEHNAVAALLERADNCRLVLRPTRQIEVHVLTRLAADEGVDAPTAGDPDWSLRISQEVEHVEDVRLVHAGIQWPVPRVEVHIARLVAHVRMNDAAWQAFFSEHARLLEHAR